MQKTGFWHEKLCQTRFLIIFLLNSVYVLNQIHIVFLYTLMGFNINLNILVNLLYYDIVNSSTRRDI